MTIISIVASETSVMKQTPETQYCSAEVNSIALNSDFWFSRAVKAQMSMAMVFSTAAIFHSLLLQVVPN